MDCGCDPEAKLTVGCEEHGTQRLRLLIEQNADLSNLCLWCLKRGEHQYRLVCDDCSSGRNEIPVF